MSAPAPESGLSDRLGRIGDIMGAPRLAMNMAVAIRALEAKPMRAVLTALGVIVAVSAMVLIAAIGEGAKWQIERSVSSMGTNMIVLSAVPDGNPSGFAAGRLTLRDIAAIRERIQEVVATAPQMLVFASLVAGNANSRLTVTGIAGDYLDILGASVARGRAFHARDAAMRARVMIIGATVARRLFGTEDPIGRIVRVNDTPFEIVGLLEERGKGLSGDPDDTALIPLETAMQRFRGSGAQAPDAIDLALVAFRKGYDQQQGIEQVRDILRKRYRVGDRDIEPFTISSTAEFMAQSRAIVTAVQFGLVGIAGISLMVGSIGITNIMLVSVSERTREIGLRMAIGARRRDIRDQFLIEAAMLCLVGGLIGLAIGAALAALLSKLLGWPFVLNGPIILIALAISVLVGNLAGAYPAMRASRLAPIEALRYE